MIADDAVERAADALEQPGWTWQIGARCSWLALTTSPDRSASLLGSSDAGVNIELLYTTFGGVRLVIVTDDLASARAALA